MISSIGVIDWAICDIGLLGTSLDALLKNMYVMWSGSRRRRGETETTPEENPATVLRNSTPRLLRNAPSPIAPEDIIFPMQ